MKADILLIGRVLDSTGVMKMAAAQLKNVELHWIPLEPNVSLLSGKMPSPLEEITFYMENGSVYRQATWPLDPKHFECETIVECSNAQT